MKGKEVWILITENVRLLHMQLTAMLDLEPYLLLHIQYALDNLNFKMDTPDKQKIFQS